MSTKSNETTLEPETDETLVEFEQAMCEPATRPWDELILVCSKCSNKIGASELPDGHARLRTEMRHVIRSEDGRTRIRVSEVSCLGVCPQERITVAAFKDGRVAVETVAPGSHGAEVLAHLRGIGALSQPD